MEDIITMRKWLSNLKIGGKITLGFIIVSLISGIVGTVGFFGISSVAVSYYHVSTSSINLIEQLEIISSNYHSSRTDLSNLVLAEEVSDKEEIISSYREKIAIIKEKLDECTKIQGE